MANPKIEQTHPHQVDPPTGCGAGLQAEIQDTEIYPFSSIPAWRCHSPTEAGEVRPCGRLLTSDMMRSRTSSSVLAAAPEYDQFSYLIVSQAHKADPELSPLLFSVSLKHGIFQRIWKHANCVVVAKGGKRNSSEAKSYRPISLLSYVGKLLEKVASRRIGEAALTSGAIADTQFGAVANRSAIDTLLAILDLAEEELRRTSPGEKRKGKKGYKPMRGWQSSLLANDIAGAFNITDPARLVEIVKRRKMPAYLCN